MTSEARINSRELRFSQGPYSWEYIDQRPEGERYRIRDRDDNAVGSAATQAQADDLVRRLNGGQHDQ